MLCRLLSLLLLALSLLSLLLFALSLLSLLLLALRWLLLWEAFGGSLVLGGFAELFDRAVAVKITRLLQF